MGDGVSEDERFEQVMKKIYHLHDVAGRLWLNWTYNYEAIIKLREEVSELAEALDSGVERRKEEMGDVLFVAMRICLRLGFSPIETLAAATDKFEMRINKTIDKAKLTTAPHCKYSIEKIWQEVKAEEKNDQ